MPPREGFTIPGPQADLEGAVVARRVVPRFTYTPSLSQDSQVRARFTPGDRGDGASEKLLFSPCYSLLLRAVRRVWKTSVLKLIKKEVIASFLSSISRRRKGPLVSAILGTPSEGGPSLAAQQGPPPTLRSFYPCNARSEHTTSSHLLSLFRKKRRKGEVEGSFLSPARRCLLARRSRVRDLVDLSSSVDFIAFTLLRNTMSSSLACQSARASLQRVLPRKASSAVASTAAAARGPNGLNLGGPPKAPSRWGGPQGPYGASRPFSTGASKPEEYTSFGYRQVPVEEKKKLVDNLFTSVAETNVLSCLLLFVAAEKYDLMNDLMSWGVHRIWKNHFVELVNFPPVQQAQRGGATGGPLEAPETALGSTGEASRGSSVQAEAFTVLDLAGGTGDIAFRLIDRALQQHQQQDHQQQPSAAAEGAMCSGYEVTVCDINADMLRVGMARAEERGLPVRPICDAMEASSLSSTSSSNSGSSSSVLLPRPSDFGRVGPLSLRWVRASGEALPFVSESFDVITIAFGLRNFASPVQGLREAVRVLKPGGRFLCLEFSRVTNPVLASLYDAYSFAALPALGSIVAGDSGPYRYLAESVRRFPAQEELAMLMQQQGFKHVSFSNMSFGVVAIHSGFKA
ncbi:hypothetical protein Emag_001272 [Eimeria magna]